MTTPSPDAITAVPGIAVGHAEVEGGGSGSTVVLGPFRAAVEVLGMATGTRELATLDPRHLVGRVDALLLTGGSAFGLAAADGVVAWLEEQGRGFDTGVARVPLVPAAVIFDLAPGRHRPGFQEGYAAAATAGTGAVSVGSVGAGAGAQVGKLAGPQGASAGGLGTAAERAGGWTVGALAVVNALGDVVDGKGGVVAGARNQDGEFLDSSRLARSGNRSDPLAGRNTSLAVVATDAPLAKVDLQRLARVAATAFARRISPVHTPFDGDVLFATSTSEEAREVDPAALLELGVAARDALERAIETAVRPADGDERAATSGP